jgi:phage shock protein PspC (stress-responsive transcriptional regulator)
MDTHDRPPDQPEQPDQPDQEPTEEQPTRPLGESGQQSPRRLFRSREDRIIGGVAGGLGRHFNVDPILFRIVAVVLTFVGGAGVLLYVAMLLLVPTEPAPGATAAPQPAIPAGEPRNRGLVVAGVLILLLIGWPLILGGGIALAAIFVPLAMLAAVGVLAWWLVSGEGPSGDAGDIAKRAALGIGVLILCWLVAVGGAWAAAAGGEALVAGIVITAGLAVLAGAFVRPVRWLILPAVVLALSAGTVSAAGIDLDGGVGGHSYRPGSVSDLRERYELGIGKLVVDIRNVDLPPGDTPLELDVGVGRAHLVVPPDVCVASKAEVAVGAVTVLGQDNGGVDFSWVDQRSAANGKSRLVVDADVGFGHFEVDDDTTIDRFDRFDGFDDEGDLDVDANTACARG